jgi:ATP-binding cassette subfamily F protein uup
LVSHDRAFLDNVVTSTLVFEGAGQVNEYVGGYSDWLRQRGAGGARRLPTARPKPATDPAPATSSAAASASVPASASAPSPAVASDPVRAVVKARRLSYKEQRELEAMPSKIQRLEAEQLELTEAVADPNLFKQDPAGGTAALQRLQSLASELEGAYSRWDALESQASG